MTGLSVALFCSSHLPPPDLAEPFASLVERLALTDGLRLVYGGGESGLMGVAFRAFVSAGREVLAVSVPSVIADQVSPTEGRISTVTHEHIADRVEAIIQEADVILVGPGGLGTLEEFCVAASGYQLLTHRTPVILFNPLGYWNHLVQHLQTAETLFGYADVTSSYAVLSDPFETAVAVLSALGRAELPITDDR